MARITWRVRRQGDAWEGDVTIPDRWGHTLSVKATASDKGRALARAGSIAERALENPALAAVLPPGAAPALKLAARALRSRTGRAALRRLRGLL